MKIRMLLAIIVTLAAVLGFTACSDGSDGSDTEQYALRKPGPAGGWIFYIETDKNLVSSRGWKYLEAAPADIHSSSTKQWGSHGTLITPTIGTAPGLIAIGAGQTNSAAIVAWLNSNIDDSKGDVTSKADRAAYLCDVLILGGYSDWFLPSKTELDEIYKQLHISGIGNFAVAPYWSSSEENLNTAWGQHFGNGYQNNYPKNTELRVRAIRAFR